MRFYMLPAIFIAFQVTAGGEELPELTRFRNLTIDSAMTETIVENFDAEPAGWQTTSNFSWKPGEGMTGSGAFFAERKEENERVSALKKFRLKHGILYKVSLNYRSEMKIQSNLDRQELMAIRFRKDGKPQGGAFCMRREPGSKKDWDSMSMYFKIPDDRDEEVMLQLLIRTARIGKVWYDNVIIEPFASRAYYVYPQRPFMLSLKSAGVITFRVKLPPGMKENDFRVLADVGGVKKLLKIRNGVAEGAFGTFAPGKVMVESFLLNMVKKEIACRDNAVVFSRDTISQAIEMENDGTMLRYGRPFLPIGIFLGTWRKHDKDIFKRIRQAGFNAVQGIGSRQLYHGRKENFLESVRAAVREMDKHQLTYLYAIKHQLPSQKARKETLDGINGLDNVTRYLVNGLKNEPNLLGWYISDENPVTQIPEIRALRELIGENDPAHPVMTLTDNPENMPDFAKTGDYLMTDIYPVGNNPQSMGAAQSMSRCHLHLRKAQATGTPVIWVPQVFAWGAFRRGLAMRYPTEQEMRSMVLLGALYDAKGYFFYAYHPIWYYSEEKDPGHSEEQWERVIASVKALNKLAPFLLSKEQAPEVKVRQIKGAPISARAFRHDGKVALLVTADGPGESEAEIEVEGVADLKSDYGKSTRIRSGTYRFQGLHIDSDVLYSAK